jgi:uncharacterized protein involved in outer membrane biogenesis
MNAWMNRVAAFFQTRRMRRAGVTLLSILVVYGILGFLVLPMVLRHVLTTSVAASLNRPITVGKIAFNPYRLRLDVEELHIADRDPAKPFVDLGHLRVKISWTSLFRLAPVVKELEVTRPAIHIVRTGNQQFNFSDLLVSKTPPPANPPPPGKPFRFAFSNIQLHDGDIRFDDQVLGQKHAIEQMELDLPFIANLPADTDIFVQPLLRMIVDGSPFKIGGRALPFTKQPESLIVVSINHFNLAPYIGYVPEKLPIKIPQGSFSAFVQVHFVQGESGPVIRVSGDTSLDDLQVLDSANAPLAGFKRLAAKLDDLEPLANLFHVGAVTLDGLDVQLVRNRDGTTNLTALTLPPKSTATAPATTSAVSVASPTASPLAANSIAAAAPPAAAASVTSSASPAVTVSASPTATAKPTPAATITSTPAAAPSPSPTTSPTPKPSSAATPSRISPVATLSPAAAASPGSAPSPIAAVTPSTSGLAAPSIAASAPNAAPPPPTPVPAPAKSPLDLTIASVTVTNSTVKLTDNSLATPATAALQNINIGLKQFALGKNAAPAAYDFAGSLSGGGSIEVKGNLDLVQSQVSSDISISQVDIPAFQAYARTAMAATFGSGKLNAHANVQTSFAASKFNVHVEPATFSVDNLELRAPTGTDKPVQWSQFGATIAQVDLATHQAVVKEVHGNGIRIAVKRERDGRLSLLSLLSVETPPALAPGKRAASKREGISARRPSRPTRVTVTRGKRPPVRHARGTTMQPSAAPAAQPSGSEWQYRVESIAIEKAQIDAEDDMPARPVKVSLTPLNLHVKDFTSDFRKPFDLELDGVVNRRGSLKVEGPVVISPLKATVRVTTRRLDLSMADSYLPKDLNATFKSGSITNNGVVTAAMVRNDLHLSYRGDATIGNVRMLDKLTGDDFVRWNSLSFDRIDFGLGEGKPKVHIGAIALSDFYARIILNANGQLNLKDITSNPSQARKSLTRAQNGPAEPAAVPTPLPSPTATPTPEPASVTNSTTTAAAVNPATQPPPVPKPLPADIELGKITLSGGHIDYSDFFIRPNYRANLTNIGGSVGAFGTSSTTPADVKLIGQINGSSPIDISGSINPLAPLAAVDITAKADGIELTELTAYSVKYTGYPIIKGTLSVDVHYTLANQLLTATNHIFLDQLTFGDRVESSTAKNLPIRLAVAILKDSKGQINLDIPVSGSLNDPQFSLGGVIFHAFMNILTKAITAPFRLLANAIGGIASAGTSEDLSYVEFAPGRSTLDAASQKRLDSVATALNARPALKLSITGRIDPSVDKPGLRVAKVDDEVRARISDSEGADAAKGQIPPDLYDKYLKKVYKAAKFDKPKDSLGLTKSLPPDEMTKLLVTNMEVSDDDLKNLGVARAQSVRQYLSTKVDPARLFTVAPKLDASGISDQGKTTRAELSLQ